MNSLHLVVLCVGVQFISRLGLSYCEVFTGLSFLVKSQRHSGICLIVFYRYSMDFKLRRPCGAMMCQTAAQLHQLKEELSRRVECCSHMYSGSKVGSSFSSSTSEACQEIMGICVPDHSAFTRGGLEQLQLDWCEAFVGLTSECTVTCTAAAATNTLIVINCGRFVSNRI